VDDATTTATTVHEIQVVDEAIPTTTEDVPMDLIATPERSVRTGAREEKPGGVAWDRLEESRLREIPVLEGIRAQRDPGGE